MVVEEDNGSKIKEQEEVDLSLRQEIPETNENEKIPVLSSRTRFLTTFQYHGSPETVLGVLEDWVKLNTKPPSSRFPVDENQCFHCSSNEILQTKKMAQLSAWRKAIMAEVTSNIS